MEEHQEIKQVKPGNNFLTTQEQVVCKRISKNTSPYSQQALTLLALHAGDTQLQASEKGGLTPGQVKYLAAKFRRQRINIFPRELLGKLNFSIEEPQNDLSTDTAKLTKADKKISGTDKGKSQKDKDKKKDKKAKKAKKSKKKSKKKDVSATKDSKEKKKKTNKKLKKKKK